MTHALVYHMGHSHDSCTSVYTAMLLSGMSHMTHALVSPRVINMTPVLVSHMRHSHNSWTSVSIVMLVSDVSHMGHSHDSCTSISHDYCITVSLLLMFGKSL